MLGYQSAVVNGQLINVAPKQGFDPLTFGQAYTGPAMWPRQGVYTVPPIMPSAEQADRMTPATYGGSAVSGVGGATAFPSATDNNGSPFSLTKSPLWWALGFLIIGILMLQHIHYKG